MSSFTSSAFTLFLCISLNGCIGATRLPEKTHGQQGSTQHIDLGFLKPGETSRTDVTNKLKPVDTGVQSERFFVARWDTSKWGAWAFLAGYGGATGGAGRLWRDANLLIEFDDYGIVKRYETFPDKLFAAKLDPLVHEAELSAEDRINVLVSFDSRYYRPASLVFSPEALEFAETGKTKKPFHFRVPREWLIGTSTFLGASGDAVHVIEQLQFCTNLREVKGPRVKKINVESTIPQWVTILRYALPRS